MDGRTGIKNRHQRLYLSDSGSVFLELALTIPIILAVFISGIAFARYLKVYEIMGGISKQAAYTAFRECTPYSDGCIDLVYNKITEFSQEVLPGSEILVSIYQYDASGIANRVLLKGEGSVSNKTPKGKETKYNANTIQSELKSLNSEKTQVSISEIFYDPPLFARLSALFPFSMSGFYETTIY